MNGNNEGKGNPEEGIDTLIGFVYEVEGMEQVAVSTGEEDYFVVMDETGKKLLKEIENDVSLSGIISKDEKGKYWIKVSAFDVLHIDDGSSYSNDEFEQSSD